MRLFRKKIDSDSAMHVKLVILHAVLGVVMIYMPSLLKLWYMGALVYFIYQGVFQQKLFYFSLWIAYNLGIEIIGRMADLSPVVPWELCKYITIPIVLLALILEKFSISNFIAGLFVILLCIPAIVFGESDFERIVFSMFGILMTGTALVYFWNRQYSMFQFFQMIRFIIYPLISILVYITLETPSFDDMVFELGANFDTTGGFGSNQISTILGLATLLLAMIYFIKGKVFGYQWIDLALMGYFFLRGLLSFSRGGILTAILAFMVFFSIISRAKNLKNYGLKVREISIKDLTMIVLGVVVVFIIANSLTNGVLLDRYKGETGGTKSGDKEKTLNTITTGRFDILVSDLAMWSDYPIWGVGGGKSASFRVNYGMFAIAAHTEFSRMLAEQGVFGLIQILFLIVYLPLYILKNRNKVEQAFLLSFLVLAILTSFHAGMRTFATPLFVGLSVIRIRPIRLIKPLK